MTVTGQHAQPAFSPAKRFDWVLVALASLLLTFGLSAIYSVDTSRLGGAYFPKQVVFAGIGFGMMVVVAMIRPEVWRKAWPVIYGINAALLAAILVVGQEKFGAQRWISVGPIDLQPSEVTKIAMAICLAAYFASKQEEIRKFSTFAISIALVAPVLVLLMLQPHLGATMSIVAIWFSIALLAGIPWRYPFAAMAAIALVLVGAFYSPRLPPQFEYMKERVVAKINPDNAANNYQQHQAVLTIGSGGIWGKGLNRGERKESGFVPMQQNDFIFTVVGEEGGLIGCGIVLLAFCAFFGRIWWIGLKAKDPYRRFLAAGLGTALGFHTIVNLGMNLGITPVVGLWLPFMSYGGTALWMCLVSVGLLLAVHRHTE